MRKHFFAIESAHLQAPVRMLSLEEEMLIVDEAAQDEAQVERDLSESERVIEVSDALEDVAVVADGIEAATPGEVALIDTASQMAVAGTDIEPEQVVPAMESYMGKRISTEGIRETARTIWENIQAFLTKVWNQIVAYFRVSAVVPMVEKRIASLEKKVKELGKLKEGAGNIKLKSGFLAVKGKVVTSVADLGKAFTTIEKTAEFVFGTNADEVAKRGEELAGVIGKFTAENHAEVMKELLEKFEGFKKMTIEGSKAGKDGDYNLDIGPELLGGGQIIQRNYEPAAGSSPLGSLERFRKSGIMLSGGSEPSPAEQEFPVLTISEMEAMLDDAKKLLKTLKDFHAGARLNKLKKASDSLKAASKKASGEISKIKQDDKGQAAVVNDYRAALNLNVAYTRWVQSPALPFYGKCLSAVKAITHVVSSSAGQYESKDATPEGDGKK